MLMNSRDYRESLRSLKPVVFVDGERIENVVDTPSLAPGINAIGLTYDVAHGADKDHLATAIQSTSSKRVNRFLHVNETSDDLLNKLELVRLVCQETGCAMRYLTMDGINALFQGTLHTDEAENTEYHQRFLSYLHDAQDRDLTIGIAMTDAKGDRSRRPSEQSNADAYVHIVERRADGIVVSGTKAIVTGAPYVHELFVLPGRAMTKEDADFAVAFAVPIDADGLRIVARPAGRPGEKAARFSAMYGQSTGVCMFDNVFIPWDRVFLAGEWQHSERITKAYATHHRHTCIGARAGFGDLLIGAGQLMVEANGLDLHRNAHLRDSMVDLIKIVESFYACGVAASVYATRDSSGAMEPDAVYSNIGKLLLATKIYDMHRLAHELSGGLVVTLPGPDEDHNPETAGDLAAVLGARPDVPYSHRINVARFIEDLTASYQGGWYSVISLHGGGSPAAMKNEIHRRYPIDDKRKLVERLLDRGAMSIDGAGGDPALLSDAEQPGQCCDTGCQPPGPATLPVRVSTRPEPESDD